MKSWSSLSRLDGRRWLKWDTWLKQFKTVVFGFFGRCTCAYARYIRLHLGKGNNSSSSFRKSTAKGITSPSISLGLHHDLINKVNSFPAHCLGQFCNKVDLGHQMQALPYLAETLHALKTARLPTPNHDWKWLLLARAKDRCRWTVLEQLHHELSGVLRRPQETPASSTPNLLWHPPSSSLHMLCHLRHPGTRVKADGGNPDIHQTTNLLWCERNNHIHLVSSGDDKNKQ